MRIAYIVAGYRSTVGKSGKGAFRFTRPDDLAADVIKHLVASVPELEKEKTGIFIDLDFMSFKSNRVVFRFITNTFFISFIFIE